MPSCPMHLADTMKFRPYLTVRTVTACVSTCISASPGKCTTERSARFRSSRNELEHSLRSRKSVRKHNVPAGAIRAKRIRTIRRHREETDFSVEKLRRHSALAGKCSFRDIDADRNNFVGDFDFSSDVRMHRDSQRRAIDRLINSVISESVSLTLKIILTYRVREIGKDQIRP